MCSWPRASASSTCVTSGCNLRASSCSGSNPRSRSGSASKAQWPGDETVIPLHDDNPTQRKPVVTILLIAANVIVFLFWQPHGGTRADPDREARFLYEHAAVPCEVTKGEPVELGPRGPTCDLPEAPRPFPHKNVYLALFTSMFLHANLLHIGGDTLRHW